uniref:Uncharacterized protein n=1 Tax=Bionectria ochroleuca TaxID=29856 RepID=A0A8H7N7S1_BIOOC
MSALSPGFLRSFYSYIEQKHQFQDSVISIASTTTTSSKPLSLDKPRLPLLDQPNQPTLTSNTFTSAQIQSVPSTIPVNPTHNIANDCRLHHACSATFATTSLPWATTQPAPPSSAKVSEWKRLRSHDNNV